MTELQNPFQIILDKIEEIQTSRIKWIKLTKWCKQTGMSQTFALDCFKEAISRPHGRIYMIDLDIANSILERDRLQP